MAEVGVGVMGLQAVKVKEGQEPRNADCLEARQGKE